MRSGVQKNVFVVLLCLFQNGKSNFYGEPLFSSKTPYFWLQRSDRPGLPDSGASVDYLNRKCQVFYVDGLFRHGARFPNLHWIQDMTTLKDNLVRNNISERHPFIGKWENHFSENNASLLSPLGEIEMKQLGKRFAETFRSLLQTGSNQTDYFATFKQRTQNSARAFDTGMRTALGEDRRDLSPVIDNTMLRFFDNCEKYENLIESNKSALHEVDRFSLGQEVQGVVRDVSNSLTGGTANLTLHEVSVIQQICAMELGLYKQSDWCQLFSRDDLEVLDYLDDLKTYWIKAYGYRLNYEISAPYFKDIIQRMDTVIAKERRGEKHTLTTLRFGHAETVAPVFAALGLFRDKTPLMANNYNSERNRLFRSSRILPFSANIVFALYKCPIDFSLGEHDEPVVMKVYVNEQEVMFPWCDSNTCLYNSFRSQNEHALTFDFDKQCNNTPVTLRPINVIG